MVANGQLEDLLHTSEKLIGLEAELAIVNNSIKLNDIEKFLTNAKERCIIDIVNDSLNKTQLIEAKATIKIINIILSK
jgi:hypothetical protein